MTAVNLGKFTLTKSITNLTWKQAQCVTKFYFAERDIQLLSDALPLPHKILCCQGTIVNNIEALCILLKRLPL